MIYLILTSGNAREQVGNSTRSGRNVALSRSISTPTGTGWAVPGNGIVCLVVPDPIDGYGITCTETRHARTHGIAVILISPDDPETAKLTLLTPRGSHITATMTDGGTHRLHADQDGVVSAALEAAKSVTVETSSGTARLDMPAPPPAAANGNCPIGQVIEAGADC